MIGPVTIAVLTAVLLIAFATGFYSRRKQEARARLLEVLARAVEGSRPLPPLIARIASETRGSTARAFDRFTQRLSTGFGLAEAFEDAGRVLPPRDVEAIRHAEDGNTLAPVLATLARDAGQALTYRHRIALAIIYPCLLIPLFAFTWWRMQELLSVYEIADQARAAWGSLTQAIASLSFLADYLPFLAIAAIGLFVLFSSPAFARLRPRRISWVSRTSAESRLYQLCALHLDAGRPLPDALRRAAAGAGRRSVRRRAEDAAARIARGDSVSDIWPWFPPAGASLASRLRRLGDLRRERQRTRIERRLSLIHPITVLVFATLAFVEFRVLVELFEHSRRMAMPW